MRNLFVLTTPCERIERQYLRKKIHINIIPILILLGIGILMKLAELFIVLSSMFVRE